MALAAQGGTDDRAANLLQPQQEVALIIAIRGDQYGAFNQKNADKDKQRDIATESAGKNFVKIATKSKACRTRASDTSICCVEYILSMQSSAIRI